MNDPMHRPTPYGPLPEHSPFSSLAWTFERASTPRGSRPVPPAGYRNIALEISFDGREFIGYQYQPHGKSVQEILSRAWATLTREPALLYGCSRLDALVSAWHFVLNLYSRSQMDCDRLLRGLNGILQTTWNAAISVRAVWDAPPMFHARFDTVGKHYRYLVWYGRGEHALMGQRAWNVRSRNPVADLEAILRKFEGTHDFAAFRSQDCTAQSTERTIHRIRTWTQPRYPELTAIDVWGDGFLKNMIRNIVGTAVDISTGKLAPDALDEAFSHGDRARVGQCAPAHGLSLVRVYYDSREMMFDTERNEPEILF